MCSVYRQSAILHRPKYGRQPNRAVLVGPTFLLLFFSFLSPFVVLSLSIRVSLWRSIVNNLYYIRSMRLKIMWARDASNRPLHSYGNHLLANQQQQQKTTATSSPSPSMLCLPLLFSQCQLFCICCARLGVYVGRHGMPCRGVLYACIVLYVLAWHIDIEHSQFVCKASVQAHTHTHTFADLHKEYIQHGKAIVRLVDTMRLYRIFLFGLVSVKQQLSFFACARAGKFIYFKTTFALFLNKCVWYTCEYSTQIVSVVQMRLSSSPLISRLWLFFVHGLIRTLRI